ncbi:condensation domain-containing protein, partial [Paraglaciecola sp.]|uniref:condensation domain-containing protein n=1 Tax=Paraglaciecola sp. TaxID=1920173 RepID=UPI0030F489BA
MDAVKEILVTLYQNGIKIYLQDGKLKTKCVPGAITPEIGSQISAYKDDIVKLLFEGSDQTRALPGITPIEHSNGAPLSFSQQRLWIIDQLQGGSPEYNISLAFRVRGTFNVDVAEAAIRNIVERHESLRTVYAEVKEGPIQRIQTSFDFKFKRYNLSELIESEQKKRIQVLIEEEESQPFDLANDLMVRGSYLHLDGDSSNTHGIVLFNMHHIASDGWSIGVLVNEFVTYYETLLTGRADPLKPLTIQYADYAAWQRRWMDDSVLEKQLAYWSKQLDQVPTVHSLPLDTPRSDGKATAGAKVTGQFSIELTRQLEKLARRHGVTMFMMLQGILSLVLSRNSYSNDIVVGTPVANRTDALVEPLIGFFVNTLVLRTNTDWETLEAYLQHVKQVNLDAQANQDVPFEQLVDQFISHKSLQYTPLFQIVFSMDTNEVGVLSLPGVKLEMVGSEYESCKFDLEISASFSKRGITFTWIYDKSIFNEQRVQQLQQHLEVLTNNLVLNSSRPLKLQQVLTKQEQKVLLQLGQGEQVAYDQTHCLHEMFEAQVQRHADKVA